LKNTVISKHFEGRSGWSGRKKRTYRTTKARCCQFHENGAKVKKGGDVTNAQSIVPVIESLIDEGRITASQSFEMGVQDIFPIWRKLLSEIFNSILVL
jgi:hypothetical protein